MPKTNTKKLSLSAMFIALGIVLPIFTAQMESFGSALLPMHIPVLFCGLLCGSGFGAVVGFILPLLRSFLFSMPPLFPNAVCMAFELATYGLITGLLYSRPTKKSIRYLYVCLICAMISGRIVWGIAEALCLGFSGSTFTLKMFIAGSLFNAIPGIILQLVLIPGIMGILQHTITQKEVKK